MLDDGSLVIIIRVLIISITKVDSSIVSAGLRIVSPLISLGHQTSALRIVLLLLSLAALGTRLLGGLLLPGSLNSKGVGDGQGVNVNVLLNVVHGGVQSSLDPRSHTWALIVSGGPGGMVQVEPHDVLPPVSGVAANGAQHPCVL